MFDAKIIYESSDSKYFCDNKRQPRQRKKASGRSLGRDISERFGEKGSVRGLVQEAVCAKSE